MAPTNVSVTGIAFPLHHRIDIKKPPRRQKPYFEVLKTM